MAILKNYRWDYTIKIRHLITGDTSQESMNALIIGIRQEILKLPILYIDPAEHILKEMQQAADLDDIDLFNVSFNRLWDWFDDHRIWVDL